MNPILKSEFAARLKVSKTRVSQMVGMGMPTTADGKINVPDALAWIEAHIDSSHKDSVARRVAARAAEAAAPPGASAPPPPQPDMSPLAATPGSLPDPARILLSAKAKRALVELRRAEREERKATGELIEVAEVAQIIEELVTNAKTRLLSMGSRLGPRLAVEHDAAQCTALIDAAVREALEELVSFQVAA